MHKSDQRTRIVSATPIEAGKFRLLPAVLVMSQQGGMPDTGYFSQVRMRPVSVVAQGPEGARWHALPDATQAALSQMAAVGAIVAAATFVVIVLARLARR